MSSLSGLVDHRGNPIRSGKLTKEIATPDMTGVRSNLFASVSSGLTPQRLAQIVTQVDSNNDNDSYLTLAMEMEERDLHYHSVLSTRKLAVGSLDVNLEAFSDEPRDVEIADFVRGVVTAEPFQQLVDDSLDGLGKGYSMSEILWDSSEGQWVPDSYIWRDQRHFIFDRKTGQRVLLRGTTGAREMGLPLEAYKFVQHIPRLKTGLPIRGGLARLCLVAYMCKGYALKDWLAFAEVFGMPLRVGKYGPGATPDQKSELLRAVANIGIDAAAIVPDSMIIDFVESARQSGDGGEKLFQGLADWLDSQVSKGVLGQTMTTDDGSSQSQANVHNDVRKDIRDSDAAQLAATLRRDVVKPLVDLNFGPLKRGTYPTLSLMLEEGEDLKALSDALTPFIDRGLQIEASVIRDKFNLPEPEVDSEVLKPKGGGQSSSGVRVDPEEEEAPEDTSDPVEDEAALNREQQQTLTHLMRKVRRGEDLSANERTLLVALAQAERHNDEIDRVADRELREWEATMDPMLKPIINLANTARSYSEFQRGLSEAARQLNGDRLVQAMAVLMFKARGLGDATDDNQ